MVTEYNNRPANSHLYPRLADMSAVIYNDMSSESSPNSPLNSNVSLEEQLELGPRSLMPFAGL
jgi:hypothetical protein